MRSTSGPRKADRPSGVGSPKSTSNRSGRGALRVPRFDELPPLLDVLFRQLDQPTAFQPPQLLRRRTRRPPHVLIDRLGHLARRVAGHLLRGVVNAAVFQFAVQPGQRPVKRLAAAHHLDLLAGVLQRFQTQDVPQEKLERTIDVFLQGRGAEHALGVENLRHLGDHVWVAEAAVIRVVLLFMEAKAVQVGRVPEIRPQVGGEGRVVQPLGSPGGRSADAVLRR